MNKGYNLNQITLVTDIMAALSRQEPGLPAEPRLINCVISAANSICEEFAKPIVKASAGMGLTDWLASDDVGMSSRLGVTLSISLPLSSLLRSSRVSSTVCWRERRSCSAW